MHFDIPISAGTLVYDEYNQRVYVFYSKPTPERIGLLDYYMIYSDYYSYYGGGWHGEEVAFNGGAWPIYSIKGDCDSMGNIYVLFSSTAAGMVLAFFYGRRQGYAWTDLTSTINTYYLRSYSDIYVEPAAGRVHMIGKVTGTAYVCYYKLILSGADSWTVIDNMTALPLFAYAGGTQGNTIIGDPATDTAPSHMHNAYWFFGLNSQLFMSKRTGDAGYAETGTWSAPVAVDYVYKQIAVNPWFTVSGTLRVIHTMVEDSDNNIHLVVTTSDSQCYPYLFSTTTDTGSALLNPTTGPMIATDALLSSGVRHVPEASGYGLHQEVVYEQNTTGYLWRNAGPDIRDPDVLVEKNVNLVGTSEPSHVGTAILRTDFGYVYFYIDVADSNHFYVNLDGFWSSSRSSSSASSAASLAGYAFLT